nr:proteolytic subunit 2 of clp protease [Palmellopsis texensis]
MPIGVPRIIYCWGEELPAQWTDIYNFIFRRRMIFLMQYLDDELCNQICGLLINIHMEDRSKELEQKEMQRSSGPTNKISSEFSRNSKPFNISSEIKNGLRSNQQSIQGVEGRVPYVYELLTSEEDLAIDENFTLEQYTLQKITMDWLNWNANFFNYSDLTRDEPYLFYLGEILSKDFTKDTGNLLYTTDFKKNLQPAQEIYTSSNLEGKEQSDRQSLQVEGHSNGDCSKNRLLPNGSLGVALEQAKQPIFLSNPPGPLDPEGDFIALGPKPQLGRRSNQLRSKTKESNKSNQKKHFVEFLGVFKTMTRSSLFTCIGGEPYSNEAANITENLLKGDAGVIKSLKINLQNPDPALNWGAQDTKVLQASQSLQCVYSPFRFLANFAYSDYSLKNFLRKFTNISSVNVLVAKKPCFIYRDLESSQTPSKGKSDLKRAALIQKNTGYSANSKKKKNFAILKEIAKKQLTLNLQTHKNSLEFSKKALSQRTLKHDYRQDLNYDIKLNLDKTVTKSLSLFGDGGLPDLKKSGATSIRNNNKESFIPNPLIGNKGFLGTKESNREAYIKPEGQRAGGKVSFKTKNLNRSTTNFSKDNTISSSLRVRSSAAQYDFYRKQAERTMQEEESKKVFVIINSFGGSVGNGITVHDALQFIKAGSLTLALGVAASASSLVLAGGTIGERYVTEGCHTMIHQPEGGISGQASDIWIDSAEIMKIRLDVAEIYSLSTYRPRHKILRDLDRDFYLTATETVYYGLADEIATNDVMHSIIEETNKVWDYHESQQQRLLETRESNTSGLDTQTQN